MSLKTVWASCGVLCLATAIWTASCGMVPPREYREVEKAKEVDVGSPAPLPLSGIDAGTAGDEVDASVDAPEVAMLSVGLPGSVVPAMTIAQVLGKTRKEIEEIQSPVAAETKEEKAALKAAAKLGWIKYTENLRIRFDKEKIAVSFEQQVPAEMSCVEAAKWLGFREAPAPSEETEAKCVWTEKGGAAGLGNGVFGELDLAKRLFTANAPPAPQAPEATQN